MFLYGITLFPLVEELQTAEPGMLSPLYVDNAEFDGLENRSAQILNMLMEMGPV